MKIVDTRKEIKDTSRYHVPNLERALEMMEYLGTQSTGLGVTEIALALGIPKNSVFRIAKTLDSHGYLVFDEERKTYSLGRKILTLGHAAVGEENLIEKSLDILRALRNDTTETSLIGTMIGNEGVVLESAIGTHPVKFTIEVGHRFPLHTAAPGKAVIAFLPKDEQEIVLSKMDFKRFTPQTIVSRAKFQDVLTEAQKLGYAQDDREEHEELRCVAAPIFNHHGYPIAALWVTAPAYRLKLEELPALGEKVKKRALQISKRFGYENS